MTRLSRRRRVVFALVAALGLAAALELLLAAIGLPTWRELQDQAAHFAPADRAVAEHLARHVTESDRGRRVPGRSYWLYTPVALPGYTVNAAGFRGPAPGSKRPSELRVAVLGGSAVAGWLVADDATVPAFLANALEQRLGGRPVTVVNLGVEGFRCQQEVELAEDLLPSLAPDLVVALHGANDLLVAHRDGFVVDQPWQDGGPEPPLAVRYRRPGLAGRAAEAAKRSRLVTGLLLAELGLRQLRSPPPSDPDRLAALVAGHRLLLARLDAVAAASSARAVVFLQPLLPDKHPRSFAEEVRLATAERRQPGLSLFAAAATPALAALGTESLPVRDLGALFAACPEPRYQDFVHLDPAGNRVVAEAIADALVALGLVD